MPPERSLLPCAGGILWHLPFPPLIGLASNAGSSQANDKQMIRQAVWSIRSLIMGAIARTA